MPEQRFSAAGNLLISLDEVFDSVEAELRKVEDLAEAFAAYDKLIVRWFASFRSSNAPCQAHFSKPFFCIRSTVRQTSDEIRSAMLIVDEREGEEKGNYVSEMLDTFVKALPNDVNRNAEDGREPRYSFKLTIKDDLIRHLARNCPPSRSRRCPKFSGGNARSFL